MNFSFYNFNHPFPSTDNYRLLSVDRSDREFKPRADHGYVSLCFCCHVSLQNLWRV